MFNSLSPWREGQKLHIKNSNGDNWPECTQEGENPVDIFRFTEEKRSKIGTPRFDLESRLQAGYASAIGFPENETMIAWGTLLVSGLPSKSKFHEVEVAISEDTFFIWWSMGKFKLIECMAARFDDIQGAEPVAPLLVDTQFTVSAYAGQNGWTILDMPILTHGPRITNDPHANRRSMECHYTAADMIKKRFETN
jgi:hypothetical protein